MQKVDILTYITKVDRLSHWVALQWLWEQTLKLEVSSFPTNSSTTVRGKYNWKTSGQDYVVSSNLKANPFLLFSKHKNNNWTITREPLKHIATPHNEIDISWWSRDRKSSQSRKQDLKQWACWAPGWKEWEEARAQQLQGTAEGAHAGSPTLVPDSLLATGSCNLSLIE